VCLCMRRGSLGVCALSQIRTALAHANARK
jgi:hypothetical protein